VLIFASSFNLVVFLEGLFQKTGLYEDVFFNNTRRAFIKKGVILSSLLPFVSVLHGITLGRFNYKVYRKKLSFKDLPVGFDGLKVLQISDLHLGSFKNKTEVQKGIDLINAQKADLVLFTGDMVNYKSDEIRPWVEMLSEITPPYGKFSIMGNHDYGDYVRWKDEKEKIENIALFEKLQKEMGFKLLRNENLTINKDGHAIYLAGSENWGKGVFSKYGDIEKTLHGIPKNAFTILMSHDPSHFDLQVKDHANFVHLTLSGHTHGMQFGIEVPGFIKWSPVKYRYPKWAGLYEEKNKYLYVNRGFGYIGFPGRVGIWPEITVLELKKA
jgi:predicted MPP superfamily phosphohydrolase